MRRSWTLRFKSVGMKLFIILFCSIVLLSSVLGLTSYHTAKGIITDEVAAASAQSIVQAADKLDFLLAEYEAALTAVCCGFDIKSGSGDG
jgi:methyl-accepting chemotaxis protein